MVKEKITRSYLETLSFSELLSLCDDFGLDIPENFDYHILVGELLEFSQESEEFDDEMDIEVYFLATPDLRAASATALATAGPTLGSKAAGMM